VDGVLPSSRECWGGAGSKVGMTDLAEHFECKGLATLIRVRSYISVFVREVGGLWEAACLRHVSVGVELVDKLEQLVRRFYTGSKLEANSILIQYLLAKGERPSLKFVTFSRRRYRYLIIP
jgi:hypothetical protein